MNWLCKHKWEIIGVEEYIDTSFGYNLPRTKYHLSCAKCGNIKDKNLSGHVVKPRPERNERKLEIVK